MQKLWFFLIILSLITNAKQQFIEENGLKLLNDENYLQFVDSYYNSLIFFTTGSGCGPCEKLLPEVEKAAKLLQEEGIYSGIYDSSDRKKTTPYSVSGFPTLLYIENGVNKTKYDGTRTYDSIYLWVFEQMNPGSKEIVNLVELEDIVEDNESVVIFLGDDPKDRTFRRYKEQSFTSNLTKFYHTFQKGASNILRISDKTQIVAYRQNLQQPMIYNSKQVTVQGLKIFVEMIAFQRPGDWSELIEKRVFNRDRQALILFTNENKIIEKDFKNFAQNYDYEEYLLFLQITPNSNYWNVLLDKFGIDQLDVGEAKLITVTKNATLKYLFDKDKLTSINLYNFINDAKDGKLKRFLRNQPSSVTEQMNVFSNLIVLDSKLYQNQMLDSDLDWVVFYCRFNDKNHHDVLRVANRVAQRLQKNKNIRIAFTDVEYNEFIDFNEETDIIKVRLYKGNPGRKQFVKFSLKINKLQEDRLTNFIYEQTSYEWIKAQEDL